MTVYSPHNSRSFVDIFISITNCVYRIVLYLPMEPFAFMECALPFAVWNDAELELVPSKIIWLLEVALMLLVLVE